MNVLRHGAQYKYQQLKENIQIHCRIKLFVKWLHSQSLKKCNTGFQMRFKSSTLLGTTKYTEIQENASLMNTVSALKVTSTSRNSSDNKNEKN